MQRTIALAGSAAALIAAAGTLWHFAEGVRVRPADAAAMARIRAGDDVICYISGEFSCEFPLPRECGTDYCERMPGTFHYYCPEGDGVELIDYDDVAMEAPAGLSDRTDPVEVPCAEVYECGCFWLYDEEYYCVDWEDYRKNVRDSQQTFYHREPDGDSCPPGPS